jgi:hypothetical protein
MRKFFCDSVLGLKADINRHCKTEKELKSVIEDLERENASNPSEMNEALLRTYRELLSILQSNKAELVSNIGRK